GGKSNLEPPEESERHCRAPAEISTRRPPRTGVLATYLRRLSALCSSRMRIALALRLSSRTRIEIESLRRSETAGDVPVAVEIGKRRLLTARDTRVVTKPEAEASQKEPP